MLIDILNHIPVYVYFLLVYLIKRGILALHDRVVLLRQMFIFPILMTYMCINSFFELKVFYYQPIGYSIIEISLGLLFGLFVGWLSAYGQVFYNKGNLFLKGSSTTLIIIIAIFVIKFGVFSYIGYNPLIVKSISFDLFIFISFMLIIGVSFGRLSYYLRHC